MRLHLAVLLLSVVLTAACASPQPEEPPVTHSPTPPESQAPPVPPTAPVRIEHRYEDLHTAPDEVQRWAALFENVQIATARSFGDRTYLLMTDQPICPRQTHISFTEAMQKENHVLVTASFQCTDQPRSPALASIPATDLPVLFELQYWWVRTFSNPHNLPDAPLPGNRSGVLLTPMQGTKVGNSVHVTGYACCLFEATAIVRLTTPDGQVASETFTTVAGGFVGPDWGSFDVILDTQAAAPGDYWLELGHYSMTDGSWILFDRVQVHKE